MTAFAPMPSGTVATEVKTLPAETVFDLIAGDVESMTGERVTVREAGPILERWHESGAGRYWRNGKGHRDSGYETWAEYVDAMADVLRTADEWPFDPIELWRNGGTLSDGHHRTQAALRAGWDKPIPYTRW